jgi:hypothetical protein
MAAEIDPSKLKGMVSEKRLEELQQTEQKKEQALVIGTTTEKELALLIEIAYSINKNLVALVEIFKGISPDKEQPKVEQVIPTAKTTPAVSTPAPVAPPTPSVTEQSPRIKEVLESLEPIKELVTADTETSAQFIMVRPRTFLGSDNFKKVTDIMRTLGGQYVSKGKDSHFLIQKQENPQ